ncbi:MAG TPA: dipicolinate synthase subunit B [Ruminococcaceae bacterium]|nr:dipicolinate synthase subunit B [Oscillospiraceae bacterium]
MDELTAGFALCGSHCTFSGAIPQMKALKAQGFSLIPIMSNAAYKTDTRFGKADDIKSQVEKICGREVIASIEDAEPIGPEKLLDIMIIAPCTGNTLAKLANGITDTSVTMAAKAHLRNQRPLLIAIATNDALSGSAKNIGQLLGTKNIFFVPFRQDDPMKKPRSAVAVFEQLPQAVFEALHGRQLQPILYS